MTLLAKTLLTGAGVFALAPAAMAQDAHAGHAATKAPVAQGAPAAQSTPATQPAPAQAATAQPAPITDTEVKQFATGALAVDAIRKDATIAEADKPNKMVEAITASGLKPDRFNEIAREFNSDPAVKERVNAEFAAQQQAQAATTTSSGAGSDQPAQ